MKAVQHFSDAYLAQASKASKQEILQFLEDFRLLHAGNDPSRLISIKIPESLLSAFRARCKLEGVRYQTQIKVVMRDWLG